MTDDILLIMHDILKDDPVIVEYCTSENDKNELNIKFYEYPPTGDMSGNWIVLEPIINGLPSGYSDETWVTLDYLFHVEVWSRNYEENKLLAKRIRDLIWEKLKFKQNDNTDEYDLEIYRDARRYEGVLHRNDLDSL